MKISYTNRAREELETAFLWYEDQQAQLGRGFLDCVELVLMEIREMPKRFPVLHGSFHRALLSRFPFAVFYTIEEREIIIHAVFDTRQNPAKLP